AEEPSKVHQVPAVGIEPTPSRLQRDARPSSCTGIHLPLAASRWPESIRARSRKRQYPSRESNPDLDLRRVAGCPFHHRGIRQQPVWESNPSAHLERVAASPNAERAVSQAAS